MAAIPTPTQAKKVDDLTTAQFDLIRQSLGINDDPLIPEKTYIIFDAISGNNNLHLDIGVSSTYSIIKGDGTVFTQYTDTGGIKILNYVNAGRYLITIDGVFSGICADAASQAEKNQYISIIGGSNYPVIINSNCFQDAAKLELVYFPLVTSLDTNAFSRASKLKSINFPLVTSIGNASLRETDIEVANFPLAISIGNGSFNTCLKLKSINFPLVASIGDNTFNACLKLKSINFPLVTSIGSLAFSGCVELFNITLNYTLGLVSAIGVNAFINVTIQDLQINSANKTEALSLLDAMISGSIELVSNFRLLYGNSGGAHILESLTVSKDGNPNISFENTGDASLLRAIDVDFGFDDGAGYILRAERAVGETFEDVVLHLISGLGNKALSLLPDGTLQALITYTNAVGATNKPLYIDDDGNIGADGAIQGSIISPIGNWNMDTSPSVTVPFPLGVDFDKCVSIEAFIIDDNSIRKIPINGDFDITGTPDGALEIISTGALLIRTSSGIFDGNTDYDSPSFNRGHVVFHYDFSL